MQGQLEQISEALTKTGKPYLRIIIDKNFLFYWGSPAKILEEFSSGDTVEYEFTQKGNFKTLSSIKKISVKKDDLDYENILEYIGNGKFIFEVIEWLEKNKIDTKVLDEMKDKQLIIEEKGLIIKV